MRITRRDFVNGALVGTGAALLGVPPAARAQGLTAEWTGYGGVGDYASSNGNTAAVVNAAHGIRDGIYDAAIAAARTVDDAYDLVIVGGGFAGLAAAYEFVKARPGGSLLLLDNHPVPGGEAKQNAVDVDGVRLIGPQGSNGTLVPKPNMPGFELSYQYWTELGIPTSFEYAAPSAAAGSIRFARENYESMFWDERLASTAWFFGSASVVDPFSDRLARAPLDAKVKREWLAWHDANAPVTPPPGVEADRWLDSMSYGDYIVNVMGLSPDVFPLADPLLAVGDFGVGATALSAYAAKLLGMPGPAGAQGIGYDESLVFSFPGGNATIARYFLKAILPGAISGTRSFGDIAGAPFDFVAMDRPESRVRVRLASTAIAVKHAGDPDSATLVDVWYARGSTVERVRARSVVMASGSWVNKHVVRDMPAGIRAACEQYHHAPILVVNVALRNWRAMAKLGVSALRWFDGLGFFANIRQPMTWDGYHPPLDPERPIMLTMYAGFPRTGVPLAEATTRGRIELFATPYAEFERRILDQLQQMLGPAGFDRARDVAAVVLNRWGHAYFAPPPGFYFGPSAPVATIRAGFGRVAFGHSELSPRQNWRNAVEQGKRASLQALALL